MPTRPQIILIDIENLPIRKNPKNLTDLLTQLRRIWPTPSAIYLATANPMFLRDLAPVCQKQNVTLIAAPPGNNSADHALLLASQAWTQQNAQFLLVSADGIFAHLNITHLAHYPNVPLARALKKQHIKRHKLALGKSADLRLSAQRKQARHYRDRAKEFRKIVTVLTRELKQAKKRASNEELIIKLKHRIDENQKQAYAFAHKARTLFNGLK